MSSSMSSSMSKSMSITRVKKLVEECGKLYNFNAEEALRALNIEVMEKKEKVVVSNSKYPLPFNGEKKENCCNGIVKNHGLYTQCSKKTGLGEDGENKKSFCKGTTSDGNGMFLLEEIIYPIRTDVMLKLPAKSVSLNRLNSSSLVFNPRE